VLTTISPSVQFHKKDGVANPPVAEAAAATAKFNAARADDEVVVVPPFWGWQDGDMEEQTRETDRSRTSEKTRETFVSSTEIKGQVSLQQLHSSGSGCRRSRMTRSRCMVDRSMYIRIK